MTGTILSGNGRCTVARKNFNNRIGVSLTLLEAYPGDDYVVLELGANHKKEIDELARIARPDAGCITCIGESHLEGFGSIEGVREAKAEIITHIDERGLLVLNADDWRCLELKERFGGRTLSYGFSETADVRAVDLQSGSRGELFRVGSFVLHLPLHGHHNVLNACAAFCLSGWAGVPGKKILQSLSAVRLPGLRCERRRIGDVEFILDCYNSNPTALQAACDMFAREETSGRRIMVCGDMLELGEMSADLHEAAGRMVAESGVDLLIAIGRYAKHVVRGWRSASSRPQSVISLPGRENAWLFLYRLCRPGDTVMVKGSRKLRLEEVVDAVGEYVAGLKKEVA